MSCSEQVLKSSKDDVIPGIPFHDSSIFVTHEMDKQSIELCELEKLADIVVDYTSSDQLHIIGSDSKGGDRILEELTDFFDGQKNKDLVVVIICKHMWSQDEVVKKVHKINEYFIARGYSRISIQQALGASRGFHSNYTQ